jgi:hypothetical protein
MDGSKTPGSITRWLVLLLLLSVVPGVAAAEATLAKAPANAHAKKFGSGWDCDRGFRSTVDSCEALELPANAHIGYSGNDWTCDPGYRRQGDGCTSG